MKETNSKIKILFICHGNICRSPMAEFIMKDIVKKNNVENQFNIESAATSAEEVGNSIYPNAREQLIKHNIGGFKDKRARQVRKSDYDEFDYLIIMDEENRYGLERIIGRDSESKISKLLDFVDDEKIKGQDIDDPWYTRDFDLTYDEIKKGCEGLLKFLNANIL